MFSKSMSTMVDTAQKRLMLTTNKDSVLTVISSDLSELSKLVASLDPSSIDFDKGGLNKFKIKSYWEKFNDKYSMLNSLLAKLSKSKKILYNSKTNISNFYKEFKAEYDKFVIEDDRDAEYLQQAIVVDNTNELLLNAITEHENMYSYLDSVIKILEASLNIAVYLAAKNTGKQTSNFAESASTIDYQSKFSQLKDMLK